MAFSSEADELVRAVKEALRPTDADRERVFLALVPRIGGGAGAGVLRVRSEATVATNGAVSKISALVLGLGLAGAGSFLAYPDQEPLVAKSQLTLSLPTPPAPVPRVLNLSAGTSPLLAPSEPRSASKSVSSVDGAHDLAREVAILSRAGSELHAGHPFEALRELEEHQRMFPRGALAQERSAARIQALCALDRKSEARAELSQLAVVSPSSPHEARARRTCGFE